ncbi:hydantoinase B/oxoprolinase family protein [Streptosporangium sp. LJ11]|uniref:hydantoinase B/oxoprolinase family protein n=1 Tax=Streptosporangium sp. LJ11 TaxID=3436927 RepID=UPI003F7A34CC
MSEPFALEDVAPVAPDGRKAAPAGEGRVRVDGARVGVVRSRLTSAAEEMRATLVRTAFNPVIYEVFDIGRAR